MIGKQVDRERGIMGLGVGAAVGTGAGAGACAGAGAGVVFTRRLELLLIGLLSFRLWASK